MPCPCSYARYARRARASTGATREVHLFCRGVSHLLSPPPAHTAILPYLPAHGRTATACHAPQLMNAALFLAAGSPAHVSSLRCLLSRLMEPVRRQSRLVPRVVFSRGGILSLRRTPCRYSAKAERVRARSAEGRATPRRQPRQRRHGGVSCGGARRSASFFTGRAASRRAGT